jgi:hypothetical protein
MRTAGQRGRAEAMLGVHPRLDLAGADGGDKSQKDGGTPDTEGVDLASTEREGPAAGRRPPRLAAVDRPNRAVWPAVAMPGWMRNGSSGRSRRDECVHGEAITPLSGFPR